MKQLLGRIYRQRALLMMALPAVILLIMFNYVPMFGVVIAFKRYNFTDGILKSPWAGIDNFRFLFLNAEVTWRIFRNTIGYYLIITIVGTICNIGLALMLHECTNKMFSKITHTIMIFPTFISYIAVAFVVYAFLANENGMINSFLVSMGMEKIAWYAEPKKWPFILVLVAMWKGVGYNSILYLSSLSGMDREMFEAAKVDGANKFQEITRITLPCLVPTICILLLLGLGGIMISDTGLYYQVTKNTPSLYSTTQTIDAYLLNALTGGNDFGASAAIALFQSVVGTILVIGTNMVIRRWEESNALF